MDSHRSFINNYNQYKRIYARDKCSNREIIGVTKTYFIAQKCKKKILQEEMNLCFTAKIPCHLSFIEKR